jgi:hypothetical protein
LARILSFKNLSPGVLGGGGDTQGHLAKVDLVLTTQEVCQTGYLTHANGQDSSRFRVQSSPMSHLFYSQCTA